MSWLLIILCSAAALAMLLAVCLLRGSALTPVKSGKDVKLRLSVSAHGEAAELEHILAGLDWLSDNGFLSAAVDITDTGLSAAAFDRACLLARRFDGLDIKISVDTEISGKAKKDI